MNFASSLPALSALSFFCFVACANSTISRDGNDVAALRLVNEESVNLLPAEKFFDSFFETEVSAETTDAETTAAPSSLRTDEPETKSVEIAANDAADADAFVLAHRIRAEYDGSAYEADGILKISRGKLTSVVSVPAGRIFTLSWEKNGRMTLTRGPFAPPGTTVDPAYLLSDLAFIFAGVSALETHFHAPWHVEQTALAPTGTSVAGTSVRRLFYKNRCVCEAEFFGTSPRNGAVRLENFERDYSFEIIPLE